MADNIYKSRQESFKNYLDKEKVETAIVMSPVNIYFFTGFYSNPHERFFACIFDNRKDNVSLFVPALDLSAAEERANVDHITTVADTDNPYARLRDVLGTHVSSFGIEKNMVSVYRYEQIADHFPQTRFVNIEDLISTKRLKKTDDEIQVVRKAVEITERVMERGINKVTPGMTELELKAEMQYNMMVLGADGPAFDTTVLSGEKTALPHGHAGKRKIREGDFLLIDMGATVDGYHSDITRTFVVGNASEKQVSMYETVLEANKKAIEAAKVGELLKNIDQAARDYIQARGYGEFFNHRIGHGLGLEVHEAPSIHSENTSLLETGMLFTIEPGVYIPGFGGVRIEDNVYIDEDGRVEVLTSYPKSLKVI